MTIWPMRSSAWACPLRGKYKEILNSDAEEFGGTGMTNPRVKTSKAMEWDELENSIEIRVAPMSCCVV